MHAFSRTLTVFGIMFTLAASVQAGDVYFITSTDGRKAMTYEVSFGGGRAFERFTAFDPKSRKFVYLDWKRGEAAPEPAAVIWDHRTGETIKLYKFPGVEQPLPVIGSIKDMKACPYTGDKNFKAERRIVYD